MVEHRVLRMLIGPWQDLPCPLKMLGFEFVVELEVRIREHLTRRIDVPVLVNQPPDTEDTALVAGALNRPRIRNAINFTHRN